MTESGAKPKSYGSADIQRVLQLLPHRYPFLLIDRLLEVHDDYSGIGLKNVTAGEPHFVGHFPGQPIMPGVLIVEGMAQAAGAIVLLIEEGTAGERKVFFMAIDGAKFRKPVVPGDTLLYHVELIRRRRGVYRFTGVATVDGEKVAEAEMTAMVSEAPNI